ncbi:DUF1203 domain-containing protein [Chromobacterium paludis]|uniref:DUF1203 domain-containing protein n=2 Tax=Chromobacterium paludis TaxID=2605945 RepID=A0A5C1DKF1_9NEIS|nr:DUF1203 domain-containing protein [Chromobacterium paludis]
MTNLGERTMAWRMEALDEAFLARARPGEALLLASYSPFRQSGPYKEYGPVFLGAQPDAAALPSLEALLAGSGAYLGERMALRAYDAEQAIIEAAILPRSALQTCLDQWAARTDIVFAMLRFPAHGCYALRLNREA